MEESLRTEMIVAIRDGIERGVLRQIFGELDLEGVLVQADALHT